MMPSKIPSWRPKRMTTTRPTKEVAHYHTSDWRARRTRILLRDARLYLASKWGVALA